MKEIHIAIAICFGKRELILQVQNSINQISMPLCILFFRDIMIPEDHFEPKYFQYRSALMGNTNLITVGII